MNIKNFSPARRRLMAAEKEHERAAKKVCRLTAKAYPIGSHLTVKLGRSIFEAAVESVNDFWLSRPGEITVRNLGTGKLRTFNAAAPGIYPHRLESEPYNRL